MNGIKMIVHAHNQPNTRAASRVVSSRNLSRRVGASISSDTRPTLGPVSPRSPSALFRLCPEETTKVTTSRTLSLGVKDDDSYQTTTSEDEFPALVSSPSSQSIGQISPSPPTLLLEGDQYHITPDGIARTLYQLRMFDRFSTPWACCIEEIYDLKSARKRFILRQRVDTSDRLETNSTQSNDSHKTVTVKLGQPIRNVDLQEIPAGVFDGAGTGATTWESSIVMSIYFASHPELLRGDIVELGSGVGLGGILCAITSQSFHNGNGQGIPTRSITLTDFNQLVIEQCKKNIKTTDTGPIPINVSKLDWYDFLPNNFERPSHSRKFDTIIACDCAYRPRDIAALALTMRSLLYNDKSQVHIFGPSNRCGLDALLSHLRNDNHLLVTVEHLEMTRNRLRQMCEDNAYFKYIDLDDECTCATSTMSDFLHIVCSMKPSSRQAEGCISDID